MQHAERAAGRPASRHHRRPGAVSAGSGRCKVRTCGRHLQVADGGRAFREQFTIRRDERVDPCLCTSTSTSTSPVTAEHQTATRASATPERQILTLCFLMLFLNGASWCDGVLFRPAPRMAWCGHRVTAFAAAAGARYYGGSSWVSQSLGDGNDSPLFSACCLLSRSPFLCFPP